MAFSAKSSLPGARVASAAGASPRAARQRRAVAVCAKKAVKKVQVVLKSEVAQVGRKGDLVTVRRGFCDNYLIPQGLGEVATQQILDGIAQQQKEAEAAQEALRQQALKIASAIGTVSGYVIKKKANEDNVPYDSVTQRDVVEAVHAKLPDLGLNDKIADSDVTVPDISKLGTYSATLRVADDVNAVVDFAVISA
uniref:Large ribosomal subunit protein bL9c n=1 Tax=Prasinoderma singulare TaxID=676789 RepID=A0A7S3C2E7_9VIRI